MAPASAPATIPAGAEAGATGVPGSVRLVERRFEIWRVDDPVTPLPRDKLEIFAAGPDSRDFRSSVRCGGGGGNRENE